MWEVYSEPRREYVDELKSPNGKKKTFKVRQKFAHPLYTYKIEVIKIKAIISEQLSKSAYNSAYLIVQPYFQKDGGRIVKMKEYEVRVEDIDNDKWILIEEGE
ncbi:hypothetical protein [Bacillus manliponensis]|uniref:hypothetical protein n=1 Tax=Bacillus manliponensis TaxID=574376 RepID=UPI0035116C9B